MKKLEFLREMNSKSPFQRRGYNVHLDLTRFYNSLRFYSEDYTEAVSDADLISSMMPEFQRDNDKWSIERKIQFVQNVISGYSTQIMLYTINNEIYSDCKVIDGQQRLTALDDWFKGKFPIYGSVYFSDISNEKRAPFVDCRMEIIIHKFKSESEAVQFYIDINKGITHSNSDIERAEVYLKSIS